MSIKPVLSAAAVAGISAVGLVVGATGAAAATTGVTVWKNGEWRAHGTYTTGSRELCIRGYNNGDAAQVSAEVVSPDYRWGVATHGNNYFCRPVPTGIGFWAGRVVTLRVTLVAGGGEVTTNEQQVTI
jgi:hypothetical protein